VLAAAAFPQAFLHFLSRSTLLNTQQTRSDRKTNRERSVLRAGTTKNSDYHMDDMKHKSGGCLRCPKNARNAPNMPQMPLAQHQQPPSSKLENNVCERCLGRTMSMTDCFPDCAPMAAGGGSLISSRLSLPAATRNSANRYAEKEMNFHWFAACHKMCVKRQFCIAALEILHKSRESSTLQCLCLGDS